MLSESQVSKLLNVGLGTLSRYVAACGPELSRDSRRSNGRSFTEDDVVVLRRAQTRMTQQNEIHVYCAWCGKELGVRYGAGVEGQSHGMCPHCAEAFLSQYELEKAALAG